MEDKIVIREKNKNNKIYWSVLRGSILILAAGVFLFFWLKKDIPPFSAWTLLSILALLLYGGLILISLLAGGYGIYFSIKGLVYGDEVLFIDKEKVHGKLLSAGVVRWKYVERIYLKEIGEKKFVEFVLKDENKFLKGFSKREKREIRMEKDSNHELIYLSAEKTKMPAEELFEKMQVLFEKSKM